jgi:undecaprenyl-diphosphatase
MEWDEQLFLVLNGALDREWSSRFFALATRLGNGWVLAALIVPALLIFDRRRLRRHLIALVLSVALGGLVVTLAKIAFDRPRPPEHFAAAGIPVHAPLGNPSDRSFPSGHTQTAFGAAVYLSCMYPVGAPVFVALAALVGLSRIALGVHFPFDVIVGAFVGAGCGLLGHRINRWRLRRRERSDPP